MTCLHKIPGIYRNVDMYLDIFIPIVFKIIHFPFYSEEQSELKSNNVEEPDEHSEEIPTNQVQEDTCENNDAENGETNGEVTNE